MDFSLTTEIIDQIMEDGLEKHNGEKNCEVLVDQEKNKDKVDEANQEIGDSVENMVEIMETFNPFNDSESQDFMCTEIPEDEVNEEMNIDASLEESNDKKLSSWLDFLKKAYANQGRAEQADSGKQLDEPTTASENDTMEDKLKDIFSEIEEEDNKSLATVEDDNNSFVSAAEEVINSFADCRDVGQQTETEKEDKEKLFDNKKTVNGLTVIEKYMNEKLSDIKKYIDETLLDIEKYIDETLSDIEKDQEKQESEMGEKDNDKLSEIKMNEYQELSEAKSNEHTDKPLATAESKKVIIRVRKSARLASQLFSGLGSVIKTEKVEGVELVMRKSARLDDARKRKTKDEEAEAEKKQKKK